MSAPRPVTTRWNAGGHDHLWDDPANWSTGVPAAGEVAQFGRGASTVDLAAAAGASLDVGQVDLRGGAVRLADGVLRGVRSPFDKRFFSGVGLRVDGGGSLEVAAGAALLGAQTVALGDDSAATLDIQGTLTDAQVYAGRLGAVSVTVEGAGARWATSGIDQSFQFGGAAAASLLIRDGGHVGDGSAWGHPDASSTMTIGGTDAGASVAVTDSGSLLRFQIIDVGGWYSGTLDIAAGAHVTDLGANIGETGDGTVSVSGAGSLWSNRDGLFVHGTIPGGTVSITDHGRVEFGSYGLQDGGAVLLDATAGLLGGVIVMTGGALSALATAGVAHSTVTVTQSIALSYNTAVSGSNVGNFFGAAAGSRLVLAGVVAPQGGPVDPFSVGGGHVVLANAGNGDFAIALYGGVLEAAQAGAAGGGPISFLGDAGATMRFDQTGAIANPIADFGVSPQDIIDLQAVVFGPAPALSWQQSDAASGTLEVSGGAQVVSLTLEGRYAQAGFAAASDGHGGTAVGYRG